MAPKRIYAMGLPCSSRRGKTGKGGKRERKNLCFSLIWNKRDYSNFLADLRFAVLLMVPFALTNHKLKLIYRAHAEFCSAK